MSATAIVGAWLVDRSRTHLVQQADEIELREIVARMQSFVDSRLLVAEHLADRFRLFGFDGAVQDNLHASFEAEATSVVGLYPDIQALNWVDEAGTIRVVVPRAGNRSVLGTDLTAHPEAGPVLAAAVAMHAPQATPPIALLQGGRGFVIYHPVFVGGRLLGTVNMAFRSDPLITAALPIGLFNRYAVRVTDGGAVLFAATSGGGGEGAGVSGRVAVADREWRVELRPTAAFAASRRSYEGLALLLAGMLGAATISLLVFLAMRHADRLRHSEARFRDYLETSSDYYWEMDAELRYTFLSERFSDVTKLPAEALIGRPHQELTASIATHRPALAEGHGDTEPHRPFRDLVDRLRRPDGSEIWLAISGKPVFDSQGRLAGYRGTGRDVTVEMTTLRQSQELREQAEQASRSKSAFLAHMSHDLRTPLNSIIGFSTILDKEMFGPLGEPRYRQYVAYIRDSGELLLSLVNDVLDLSRIESGEQVMRESWVDVRQILETVASRAAALTADGTARLTIAAAPSAPPLYADARAITQILDNLVANAIKHAGDGARITLSWGVDADGGGVLQVADTGRGVPPEISDRLTEPFVHGNYAHSLLARRRSEGTGLGLSIVDKLAGLHGAALDIVSAPGDGTRATIRFPPDRVGEAQSA